jgi:hypothetical protein
MPPSVIVRNAPRPRWRIVPFFAVMVLTIGAHAAAAQSWPDSGYAGMWAPKDEKVSLHLHGGLFSPIDVNAPSPTVGLRLSKLVGSHLQAGVLTGWTLERKDETQSESSLPGPQPKILLARAEAQIFPLMGFLRVNLTEKHWLVPYFGVGTGYEWLTLKATDYRTQVTSNATYSNWAWEGWGGLGIRLGKELRVNGEVFYNGATLERDVVDQNDVVWKEVVNLNGVGARLGLDIIFK